MDPETFLDGGTVTVSPDTYVVAKTNQPVPWAFATIRDGRETTVVAVEGTIDESSVVEADDGWRLLTFEMTLPFDLVGFLAAVATALAEAGVAIFALSAYSTDHVLVDEADLAAATRTLEGLGCTVTR